MTKKTQTLNFVTLTKALGISCFRMMFSKDYEENVRLSFLKSVRKNQPKQASVEPSKTEIVNDIEPSISEKTVVKTNSVDFMKLIEESCRIVLNERSFTSSEDFLSELAKVVYFNSSDLGCLEMVPKNVEDCEKLLKDFGLYQDYLTKLELTSFIEVTKKGVRLFRTPSPDEEILVSKVKRVRRLIREKPRSNKLRVYSIS